ncbi:hypothetical protein GXP67_18165 [Rhodocytophaga rosea]|uniref:Uncharacterized protein n=1 Tax=Rhodocytophaga rosea TaxID=2704465 RepID=A0A6C0GKE3_9BACT|nr:hypothetical protein [Rhodocytophaga rosea]QHT68429.1 hypothetical protein GXP67_18165 [Rhodocytophaga rosea]
MIFRGTLFIISLTVITHFCYSQSGTNDDVRLEIMTDSIHVDSIHTLIPVQVQLSNNSDKEYLFFGFSDRYEDAISIPAFYCNNQLIGLNLFNEDINENPLPTSLQLYLTKVSLNPKKVLRKKKRLLAKSKLILKPGQKKNSLSICTFIIPIQQQGFIKYI